MAYGDGMTKLSPCPDETVLERLLAACRKLEGHANKELAGHADRIEKLAERVERDA